MTSFLKSRSKKSEASSFNNIELTGFYRLTKLLFAWARMLVSINQINWLFFFPFSFKKNSKRDICVNVKSFIVVYEQTP